MKKKATGQFPRTHIARSTIRHLPARVASSRNSPLPPSHSFAKLDREADLFGARFDGFNFPTFISVQLEREGLHGHRSASLGCRDDAGLVAKIS
jgi:hypothetical protein